MTPLLMRIFKAELDGQWPGKDAPLPSQHLISCHPFDVSQIVSVAGQLVEKMRGEIQEHMAFLPFPSTWLEWRVEGGRMGVKLFQRANESRASCELWTARDDGPIRPRGWGLTLYMQDEPSEWGNTVLIRPGSWADPAVHPGVDALAQQIYAFLAIINTPRITGATRSHSMHKGFARRLRAYLPLPEMFPVSTWTETIISPPEEFGVPNVVRSQGWSGEKARHWVRAHWGFRWGQVCFIRAHERGNDKLGNKQTRYRVVA